MSSWWLLWVAGGMSALIFYLAGEAKKVRREDKERDANLRAEGDRWQAKQDLLPRYRVVVRTKSGVTYKTGAYWPSYHVSAGGYIKGASSHDKAVEVVQLCLHMDHVRIAELDRYIPMCEVQDISIEEVPA